MKILVFGGAGFIGHHLVNQLQHNHDVCVYDNFSIFGVKHESHIHSIIQTRTKQWYNVETVNGSMLDSSLIQNTFYNFQPDVVLNLAGHMRASFSEKYPVLCAEGMIQGMINTMNYTFKKYIHISSSNVYGSNQDNADETNLCAPINLYSSIKLAQENLLKSHSANRNFGYIIFRPISVFGNNDLGDRMVPKFIKSAVQNQEIFYAQDTITNITYVDDFVQALVLSIESDCVNETFNISSGYTLTIKQLGQTIIEHYNSSSKLIPVNKDKYFPNTQSIDITKVQNILGYKRKYDLFQALEKIDPSTIY